MTFHDCFIDPRNDCPACRAEEARMESAHASGYEKDPDEARIPQADYVEDWQDDVDEPPDREPTPEQEWAWDLREDDLRGRALD